MITKDMLREYEAVKAELAGIERHMEELEASVYNVRGGRFSFAWGGRKSRTIAEADFSGIVAKLVDIKALYEKKWDALIDLQKEIEEQVEALPRYPRILLRARYIDGLSWDEAADLAGYSTRQAHRIIANFFLDTNTSVNAQ